MVPGMTERELAAAEARRLDWLGDAVLGPTRRTVTAPRTRPSPFAAMRRRGLMVALALLRRARRIQFAAPRPRFKRPVRQVIA
jgi:hypothetical protein